jgi:glc operon protein GlcG
MEVGMSRQLKVTVLLMLCGLAGPVASAQQKPIPTGQMSVPYGPPITLEAAKKVAQPAIAEARKNNWTMAVAIVDSSGELVYFERMDNTQLGSINTAINKARSAARFKRPTKAFQDMIASGGEGLRALGLDGAMVVEGGIPLVMDGKIIGAIGASGGTSAQDGQCAKAAADTVK